MACWYFLFEGKFKEGDPVYGLKGVCSSCIVPEEDYFQAKANFISALAEYDIELVQIEDFFNVTLEDMDISDPDNKPWIEWHNQAVEESNVLFDPWQIFDDERPS
ncbi:MAG: hypothetical protein KZQ96_22715 [Candidatus Thiodiazotropha sp. (ex Lucinoma borealis)]|nr:hypothetical protein [Candidatus Thiodiazotropha sp. (ex Lucinoma borealis)]